MVEPLKITLANATGSFNSSKTKPLTFVWAKTKAELNSITSRSSLCFISKNFINYHAKTQIQ